jgi:hypothetical protein
VTVILGTGARKSYAVGDYVASPGDMYMFTAFIGGYAVDVRVQVKSVGNQPQCDVSLSNLRDA